MPTAERQPQLITAFSDRFLAGGRFHNIVEARQQAQEILGEPIFPGSPLTKLVDESIERGLVRAARLIVASTADPLLAYDRLVDLYDRQPALNSRSSTSVSQQAYSTPIPIAYLAATLADITAETTVFEPTAGNGALLLLANPAKATVNELNPERAADLRQQGYAVTENDACTFQPPIQHDVVIMNPPFGSVANGSGGKRQFDTGAYLTTQIDHAIALNSLKAMKPDGRAVLILGGKLGTEESGRSERYHSQLSRAFYYTLYQQYRVVDHFSIRGDLYRKQGAGYPIDLILIEGQGRAQRRLPAADVPRIYRSFAEIKELLHERVVLRSSPSLVASLSRRNLPERADAVAPEPNPHPGGLPETPPGASNLADSSLDGGGEIFPARNSGVNLFAPGSAGHRSSPASGSGNNRFEPRLNNRQLVAEREAEPARAGISPNSDRRAAGSRAPAGANRANEFRGMDKRLYERFRTDGMGLSKTMNAELERQIVDNLRQFLQENQLLDKLLSGSTENFLVAAGSKHFSVKRFVGGFTGTESQDELLIAELSTDNLASSHRAWLVFNISDRQLISLKETAAPDRYGGFDVGLNAEFALSFTEALSVQPEPPKQVPYTPRSQAQPVGTLVPVNMQTATLDALARLENQVGWLDDYAADRLNYSTKEELYRYFSAEQIDAIALAIANLEKRSGFIIGDQTGIGKGRVVAAMMRYAKETGRVPIFVTKGPELYADIFRDLADINLPSFQVFVTNDTLNIQLPTGRRLRTETKSHRAEMQALMRDRTLGNYDAIFTTYSQLQTVKREEPLRRDFLRTFAQKAILIMDESHEAGGSASKKNGATGDRADFSRELIELADGVLYSSATYAKRPDVMDLYAKTDMRKAVSDISSLVSTIQKGGVPMQQALATMLTEAGQYVRRERSFEGVNFLASVLPVEREVANNLSLIMGKILEFDRFKIRQLKQIDKEMKAEGKRLLGDNAVGNTGADSTNFTSIMHNLIKQSLLALKAEATVQKSLELLRKPDAEKPVIALSNTMGSFIGEYAKLNHLKVGDAIDLNFGDLLKRYLLRTRDITLTDPYGKVTRRPMTDEELGAEGVAEYESIFDLIDETDFSNIPISPIDYIKQRLASEKFRVAEITGRKDTIAYSSTGSNTYEQRPPSEINKGAAIDNVAAFNRGDIDIIILNRSGSTGISLHASHQFRDRRPRHMIIAQPDDDVNCFMQMLGRIHRTGQVITPNYTLLMADIPAEKRPGAVLVKKMASLNANTTAARNSEINLHTIPDFMNEYGELVAEEILLNDPVLDYRLAHPLMSLGSTISKLTGRIPLLPLDEQERVYNQIEREYRELIERQEALGESLLEAKTLDLDARTIARMELIPADPNSDTPFTGSVDLEVIDAKTQRKPVTTLEAINYVRKNLELPGVETVEEHDFDRVNILAQNVAETVINKLKADTEKYRAIFLTKLQASAVEKFNEKIDKQLERVAGIIQQFPLGERVRIVTDSDNILYGVVAKIWQRGEPSENPTLPSNWRVQFLLADPVRELTVTFSKLNTYKAGAINVAPETQNWYGQEIYEVFDLKQLKNREERQIFTGNILRAYERFKGQLINYTDRRGKIRQGLLTPRGFDIEKSLQSQPVVMPTIKDAISFLTDATGKTGQLKTLDELLTIRAQKSKQGDGFLAIVPQAKATAGHIFTDPDILNATNSEFYSVGDYMQCLFTADRLETVLETLTHQKNFKLAAFQQQDIARQMLGITLPELSSVETEEFGLPEVDKNVDSRSESILNSPINTKDETVVIPEYVENESDNLAKIGDDIQEIEDDSNRLEDSLHDNAQRDRLEDENSLLTIPSPDAPGLEPASQIAAESTEEVQLDLFGMESRSQPESERSSCEELVSSTAETPTPQLPSQPAQTPPSPSNESDRVVSPVEMAREAIARCDPTTDNLLSQLFDRPQQYSPSLQDFREWYRSARALGRSDKYLHSIQQLGEAVKAQMENLRDDPVLPISEAALAARERDLQAHQQLTREVLERAIEILKRVGCRSGNECRYSGKIYQLHATPDRLTIADRDRGAILQMESQALTVNKLTAGDAHKFANFIQILNRQKTPTKQPEYER